MHSMFDDDFDKKFDRHFDRMDKMMDRPVRTFLGVGTLVLIANLIFWGAIIFGILFGLNHYGVI